MSPAPARISRPIQGNGPVENVSLSDLECGGWAAGGIYGSKPAALHAPATAGETVNLRWTLWPESHQGPLITYMARCPDTGKLAIVPQRELQSLMARNTGCQDYQTNGAPVWFKIAEDGLHKTDPDWLKAEWAVTPLMKNPNSGTNYTIPKCLEPGFYLVRHELLALHSAWAENGAQFYPG